jgi:DNA relaxase NicK
VTPDAGRTFYVGARASQVYVRIYEKGLKYAHDVGLPITDELRDWVRVELEFKPQSKGAKDLAAGLEGAQLWGSTQWTRQLAQEVLSMPTEPITLRVRRESNTERALRFAAAQYNRAFSELWRQCGADPSEFGRAWAERCGFLAEGQDAA